MLRALRKLERKIKAHSPVYKPQSHGQGSTAAGQEAVDWPAATWVVLGSLMGVGLLSLPAAYQRLGWLTATTLLVAFGGAAGYAGVLYTRIMTELPWVTSFHEMAHRSGGRWGVALVACTAYAAIFTVPAVLHLACTQALQQCFPEDSRPGLFMASFVIAVVMMPLAQLRKLADVSWVGLAGSAVMFVSMCLLCAKLWWVEPRPAGGQAPVVVRPVERQPLTLATVGVMDILFIFSGQENWPRFIAGMGPYRRRFSWSANIALAVLVPVATAVGLSGYLTRGGSIDWHDPITWGLQRDAWSLAINIGVLLATLVAYVLDVNVAAQVLLEILRPDLFKAHHSRGQTIGSAAHTDLPEVVSRSNPEAGPATGARRRLQLGDDAPGLTQPLLQHAEPQGAQVHDSGQQGSSNVQVAAPSSAMPQPDKSRGAGPDAAMAQKQATPVFTYTLHSEPEGVLPGLQASDAMTEGAREAAAFEGELMQRQAAAGGGAGSTTYQYTPPTAASGLRGHVAVPVGPAVPSTTKQPGMALQGAQGGAAGSGMHDEVVGGSSESGTNDDDEAGDDLLTTRAVLTVAGAEEPPTAGKKHAKRHRVQRGKQEDDGHDSNHAAAKSMIWALATISFVLLAWFVAYVWPSFNEVEAVVGALGAVSCIFLLPCFFALRLLRLPTHERLLCQVLCVASTGLLALGLYGSIMQLVAPPSEA